jgi:TIR domain
MTLLPSTEGQTSGRTDGRGGSSLRIFINYRAADTGWAAWALYFKLEAHFGAGNLFFDKGTLRGGMQWLEEIKSGLAGAGVLIALIGPSWMSKLVAHLQSGAQDYVVKEIDIALRNSKSITVVPVLVDDAGEPLAAELPPALRSLPGRQAERLRQGQADDDIKHLIELLNALGGAGLETTE